MCSLFQWLKFYRVQDFRLMTFKISDFYNTLIYCINNNRCFQIHNNINMDGITMPLVHVTYIDTVYYNQVYFLNPNRDEKSLINGFIEDPRAPPLPPPKSRPKVDAVGSPQPAPPSPAGVRVGAAPSPPPLEPPARLPNPPSVALLPIPLLKPPPPLAPPPLLLFIQEAVVG